jgi:hypothetical protein
MVDSTLMSASDVTTRTAEAVDSSGHHAWPWRRGDATVRAGDSGRLLSRVGEKSPVAEGDGNVILILYLEIWLQGCDHALRVVRVAVDSSWQCDGMTCEIWF